jgi:hypothetical protein
MSHSRRRCAFCGATGALSLEHVLPQWLRQDLAHADFSRTNMPFLENFRSDARQRYGPDTMSLLNQREMLLQTRVRRVCRACNNGWMSDLEQQVIPLLQPLMADQTVVLNPAMLATLSTWACKTAMMLEYAFPKYQSSTAEEMSHVRAYGEPSPQAHVWLIRHGGEVGHLGCRSIGMGIRHRRDLDLGPPDRANAHWTLLVLGHAALAISTSSVDGFVVRPIWRDRRNARRIWPPPVRAISWLDIPRTGDAALVGLSGAIYRSTGDRDPFGGLRARRILRIYRRMSPQQIEGVLRPERNHPRP